MTTLLEAHNLTKHFPIRRGVFQRQVGAVRAVDGVSFDVKRGETLGLVGESGCGKSTTGRAILQLYKPTAGEVHFEGINLVTLKGEQLRQMRRKMQMIFQDPFTSLNPRMTLFDNVGEPLLVNGLRNRRTRMERVVELLHEGRPAVLEPLDDRELVRLWVDREPNAVQLRELAASPGKLSLQIGSDPARGSFVAFRRQRRDHVLDDMLQRVSAAGAKVLSFERVELSLQDIIDRVDDIASSP